MNLFKSGLIGSLGIIKKSGKNIQDQESIHKQDEPEPGEHNNLDNVLIPGFTETELVKA